MPTANPSSRHHQQGRAGRGLGTGIAVSVLLHALLLSLQFGVPGLDLGSGGPIAVSLAPSVPPAPLPEPLPPPPKEGPAPPPVPLPAARPAAPAAQAPVAGLRLVDPLPPAPAALARQEIKPPAKLQPKPGRRVRSVPPRRRVAPVSTPLIATEARIESEFVVPLPEVAAAPQAVLADAGPEPEPEGDTPEPVSSEVQEHASVQAADAGVEEPVEQKAQAEAESLRLAAEDEARRLREEEQERERLAAAERENEARLLEERRARELLARQQAEQARAQAEQARADEQRQARQLAERRREEQVLAQQRAAEEGARVAQEEQRRLAEQLAQREREETQRLAQEQAERRRIEAQRRLAEERAQQEAAEHARAERLARQLAEGSARRAAEERGRAQAAPPGLDGQGAARPGAGPGAGTGAGRTPAGALAGGVGSRARELLRGVTIPGATPPARPVTMTADARRVVADGAERDAPLRLYVDSVRQKLERNAVLGGARFSPREVRIDPLVSVSLRSDGSIDEVTILRSTGRPDMDEAVRRFVRLNARYSAFPPNVAARFDVIEIRRVWAFADGLKLMEEMR